MAGRGHARVVSRPPGSGVEAPRRSGRGEQQHAQHGHGSTRAAGQDGDPGEGDRRACAAAERDRVAVQDVPHDEREQNRGVEDERAGRSPDVAVAVGDADRVDPQPQRRAQVGAPDHDSLLPHDRQARQRDRTGDEPHRREQSGIEQSLGDDVTGDQGVRRERDRARRPGAATSSGSEAAAPASASAVAALVSLTDTSHAWTVIQRICVEARVLPCLDSRNDNGRTCAAEWLLSPAVIVGLTSPSRRLRPQNRWCDHDRDSERRARSGRCRRTAAGDHSARSKSRAVLEAAVWEVVSRDGDEKAEAQG